MELVLNKKPKDCTIIQGFPGIGLIGTISTEFLMEHLDFEPIGKIILDDVPAVLAIHKGKIVEPLGIFHNKKNNITLVHGLNMMLGNEWGLSKSLIELAKKLTAKQVISIEGVGSPDETIKEKPEVYYYTSNKTFEKKFDKLKIDKLDDGVIVGVTSALILRDSSVPLSCIFAKTHTKLPDSKAAAEVIKALDQYLNLDVDYKPLIRRAEEFEEKLKGLMWRSKKTTDLQEKKRLDYFG
jgi:uncharacterized protein